MSYSRRFLLDQEHQLKKFKLDLLDLEETYELLQKDKASDFLLENQRLLIEKKKIDIAIQELHCEEALRRVNELKMEVKSSR